MKNIHPFSTNVYTRYKLHKCQINVNQDTNLTSILKYRLSLSLKPCWSTVLMSQSAICDMSKFNRKSKLAKWFSKNFRKRKKMAIKRKSKDPVRVVLPRRTKRQPKIRCKEAFWNFVPKKPLKNDTHINNLPDEVLLNIFCYFTTKQLYCQIRPVCRRWMVLTMSPILWRVIDVKNEVPTHVLTYWIKASPLLKSFSIQDRNDTDIIADQASKIFCSLYSS